MAIVASRTDDFESSPRQAIEPGAMPPIQHSRVSPSRSAKHGPKSRRFDRPARGFLGHKDGIVDRLVELDRDQCELPAVLAAPSLLILDRDRQVRAWRCSVMKTWSNVVFCAGSARVARMTSRSGSESSKSSNLNCFRPTISFMPIRNGRGSNLFGLPNARKIEIKLVSRESAPTRSLRSKARKTS